MTIVNKQKIKEEILNFLRNSDVFTTTQRGVATDNETFTATASQNDFTLTTTNLISNIRSVTVNGDTKTAYLDYDINIIKDKTSTRTISFYSGLSLDDEVVITYDESSTVKGDKIYPDMPDIKLIKSSYPRINFEIEETTTEPINSNHSKYNKMLVMTFRIIAERWEIDDLSLSLYEKLFDNKKSWQNNNLMRPSGESGNVPKEDKKDVFVKFLYFRLPYEFEN